MSDVKSKIKFKQQAFVHIHILCYILQNSSSFCLNIDTVDAETTVSGKNFHMLITLCVKVFSQVKSRVLLVATASYDGPLCSGLGRLEVKNLAQSRS